MCVGADVFVCGCVSVWVRTCVGMCMGVDVFVCGCVWVYSDAALVFFLHFHFLINEP